MVKSNYPSIHPFSSTYPGVSRSGSKQSRAGHSRHSTSSENFPALPRESWDIPKTCNPSKFQVKPSSPLRRKCLKNLLREASWSDGQATSAGAFQHEFFPDVQDVISEAEPWYPMTEISFGRLYLQSHDHGWGLEHWSTDIFKSSSTAPSSLQCSGTTLTLLLMQHQSARWSHGSFYHYCRTPDLTGLFQDL